MTQAHAQPGSPVRYYQSDTQHQIIRIDYRNREKDVHLEQLIAILLAKIKQNAKKLLGVSINQCVITVPPCYTAAHTFAMQNAGKIAGFEKVYIINDTSAAAITYAIDNSGLDECHLILIFDVGATSTKASIARIDGHSIRIEASFGQMNLGGDNFVARLVQHFVQEFYARTKVDLYRGHTHELMRLRAGCEELKKILSSAKNARQTIEKFYNGEPYELVMTRARFESICAESFQKMINVVKVVFEQTGGTIRKGEILKIILVGGGTRLPKLQDDLRHFMEGKELSKVLNQDEAIAIGAAHFSTGRINIQEVPRSKDLAARHKPPLNIKRMQQFLKEVDADDKALEQYTAEMNELETQCYTLKRDVTKHDVEKRKQTFIIQKCEETLFWIKANRGTATIDTIRVKREQLPNINTESFKNPQTKMGQHPPKMPNRRRKPKKNSPDNPDALYKKAAEHAIHESKKRLNKGDEESKTALSLLNDALAKKPISYYRSHNIDNITITSQLHHQRALHNLRLKNYHDAIEDTYQNMQLIHKKPDLVRQNIEMCKDLNKYLGKMNNDPKMKFIMERLKESEYKRSSSCNIL